jgi:hypothetical protein
MVTTANALMGAAFQLLCLSMLRSRMTPIRACLVSMTVVSAVLIRNKVTWRKRWSLRL